METFSALFLITFLIVLFIGGGIWIFVGIGLVGAISLYVLKDFPIDRIGLLLQNSLWNGINGWELAAIPLFIWMGEILLRSNVTDKLFSGLAPWLDRLPGRLLLTNIFGCTLFAAVSGSSTATTAAIGKITIGELDRRSYPRRLTLGSLAGSGTLGILIPPSIPMIVYGVAAQVSVVKLFAAGLLPAALLVSLYVLYIGVVTWLDPSLAPSQGRSTWRERFRTLPLLLPLGGLILTIMTFIYTGLATPSESAAIGVACSLGLVALSGKLTGEVLVRSLVSAVVQSCTLCVILMVSTFLTAAVGLLHIPQQIGVAIGELNLSPYMLIIFVTIIYLILGTVLDGISLIVLTLPMMLPIIVQAGFDPLWFGIYMVLMIEIAIITPPVGFNIFVLKALTGETVGRIALYTLPFLGLMLLTTAIITAIPAIVTWLPSTLF